MSRLVTDYFKAVGAPSNMPKSTKRKLSLIREPAEQTKNFKVSPDHTKPIVIDLSSDDEDMCKVLDSVCKNEFNNVHIDQVPIKNDNMSNTCDDVSNSSASTIIYTPGTPRKSQSPRSSYSKSPGSRDKFFSPVKKRNLKLRTDRTPLKVKKNLCTMMDKRKDDQVFLDACSGMDDKTVFLLSIINKYLSTDELRPLLLKDSQDMLTKCMNAKKPGMRLICRLYWRRVGWYRLHEIKEISMEKKNCEDDSIILSMINNLTENNIIESANCQGSTIEIGFEDYRTLLKLVEVNSICKYLKLNKSNKLEAFECLKSFSRQKSNISSYFSGPKTDNASRVLTMFREKVGPCFRLTESSRRTLTELYQLMYLGIKSNIIAEKKLELILIYDKIKRECYPDIDVPLDNASVVFNTREDFERYLMAQKVYDEFLNTSQLLEKCGVIENVYNMYKSIDKVAMFSYIALPPWLQRFTPPYLYVKILEAGLQELKKMKTDKYIELALNICTQLISQKMFRQHKKAEWYAEKALILDKFLSNVDELTILIDYECSHSHSNVIAFLRRYHDLYTIHDQTDSQTRFIKEMADFGTQYLQKLKTKMTRYYKAAKVLLEGFNSELSEVAKDFLRPRSMIIATRRTRAVSGSLREQLLRHATKEQIMEKEINAKHIYQLPVDMSRSGGKIKFETRTEDGRQVQEAEEFCISRYKAEGKYTQGEHWEGRIVTTIFFLLFWDVIYAKLVGVRGLFLTHYQMFPLDLFLESFYVNRKAIIEKRLKEIEESSIDEVVERMSVTWNSRPEAELSGISRHIGWENVRDVSSCLGPRALAALCRRLACNYRHWQSGFPDLTLWNAHTKQIKFVEVKTDSDKPSMKQLQWMHYLKENGIETEFCYVGVNTTRCKARNSMNNVELV